MPRGQGGEWALCSRPHRSPPCALGPCFSVRGPGWVSQRQMRCESHRGHPDTAVPRVGPSPPQWGRAVPGSRWGLPLSCPLPAPPPQTLLQHLPEQEEMRAFPGPLGKYVPPGCPGGRLAAVAEGGLAAAPVLVPECCSSFRDDTHKVDVINFAQNKATKCLQNENLIDKESANLLWNFIILLCRQNGVRMVLPLERLSLALSLRDPGDPRPSRARGGPSRTEAPVLPGPAARRPWWGPTSRSCCCKTTERCGFLGSRPTRPT